MVSHRLDEESETSTGDRGLRLRGNSLSIFKCTNCADEGLPANEVPCSKCGSSKVVAVQTLPEVSSTRLRAEISIKEVPQVVFELRLAMADLLRSFAQDEEPRVAARLTEIAAWFETGQAWTDEAMT